MSILCFYARFTPRWTTSCAFSSLFPKRNKHSFHGQRESLFLGASVGNSSLYCVGHFEFSLDTMKLCFSLLGVVGRHWLWLRKYQGAWKPMMACGASPTHQTARNNRSKRTKYTLQKRRPSDGRRNQYPKRPKENCLTRRMKNIRCWALFSGLGATFISISSGIPCAASAVCYSFLKSLDKRPRRRL